MSLNFIFTIDGDWDEYFEAKLSVEQRKPDKKHLISLIDQQICLAKIINGKQLHFVHTSPIVRDFFLRPEFISKWKEMEAQGGNIGVHCHEEDLYRAWYCHDVERMSKTISSLADSLRAAGLKVDAYRGGFMSFSRQVIPILEENNLSLEFSCAPGRHLVYNNVLVADWRGAPENFYRMAYEDHRKPGDSKVFEIPLGIYIERQSLWSIWKRARQLKKKPGTQMVTVLAHTYDFVSARMRLKIKLALSILKIYGKFINVREALELIRGGNL